MLSGLVKFFSAFLPVKFSDVPAEVQAEIDAIMAKARAEADALLHSKVAENLRKVADDNIALAEAMVKHYIELVRAELNRAEANMASVVDNTPKPADPNPAEKDSVV